MPRRLILALAGVACLAAGAMLAGAWAWQQLNRPLDLPGEGLFFEVERGAALSRVTRSLAARGALEHPRILDWYAGLSGAATGIRAGEYKLMPGLTGIGLLAVLARGDVFLHQFTIVEGLRFEEVLRRLRAHPAIVATDRNPAGIMAALGKPDLHPEGEFLPDTYSFPRGTTDVALLGWAHEALWSLLEDGFDAQAETSVLSSPYEGLILASIIEKETALDRERGLVSGVFQERLRRGMRLETDPTVIYGLGDSFDGNLTRAQLGADTPYNTYTRRGLPPTPIALPGAASIRAAFMPVDNYVFFVATGDPDGSHAFSRTYAEHTEAVRRYLERQRAQR